MFEGKCDRSWLSSYMMEELLDHRVLMEEEAHVSDDDVVGVGKEFAGGVVAELSGSEGVESADTTNEAALLS